MTINSKIFELKVLALVPSQSLRAEVADAAWADFGRTVHRRLVSPDMIEALTRAGLKSSTTIEMVRHLQAFVFTGAKP